MDVTRSPDGSAPLHRAIRLRHATALVVGIIIGASIFVQPSEVTARVPSIAGVLLVWLAAGAVTIAGALICAELAAIYPRSGGVYVYLSETIGRPLGFLWGWAMFWIMHSGIAAAIAVVFARYAGFVVPLSPLATKIVAITAIMVLSAINYVGVKQGSRVQTMFTAAKLGAVVAIVLLGFALGHRVPEHFVGGVTTRAITAADFFAGLAAGLFAFGGWHMVSYSSEETTDPQRTIPRALLLGTLLVTAVYIAMNAVYLYVLPLDRVTTSAHVAADLADVLLGAGAGRMISFVVMFSTLGALAGVILTGPRAYLAMAEDGLLFRWVGAVHPVFRTPHRAIVLQAVWASVLVATGSFRALFTRVVYTEWIFFGLMAIGLMLLQRRASIRNITFAVIAFAVVINQIVANPTGTALGLGFVLTGVPVYYFILRHRLTTRTTA